MDGARSLRSEVDRLTVRVQAQEGLPDDSAELMMARTTAEAIERPAHAWVSSLREEIDELDQ
jgi:hypothetical protein